MTAVIEDMLEENMVPSFCTGCYRQGRVGADFMDLAKPGLIKEHCLPNALYTFAEYLLDFGDESLQKKGFAVIEKQVIEELPSEHLRAEVKKNLQLIQEGKRDIYV
jgi:2-iminoacetate synthase